VSTDDVPAAAGGAPGPDVVDARGLRCPLPVIRLAAAARDHGTGDLLTVWSTDPAARLDVPAWARMRGHRVVVERELAGAPAAWAITVELGP
jgi:tRNA 2-thiouridine synthesizing protein A